MSHSLSHRYGAQLVVTALADVPVVARTSDDRISYTGAKGPGEFFLGDQVVLVATAGVFWSAYSRLEALDLGYDTSEVIQAIPDYEVAGLDRAAQWDLAERMAERLRGAPQVSGMTAWQFVGEDYPGGPDVDAVTDFGRPRDLSVQEGLSSYYEVGLGFFDVLGVDILRGRSFTPSDGRGTAVAIVTERGAESWWPNEDPIGHQIKVGQAGLWMTVVGVAEDVHRVEELGRMFATDGRRPMPLVFVPAGQFEAFPVGWRTYPICAGCEGVKMGARASSSTSAATEVLRSTLAEQAPNLPLTQIGRVLHLHMNGSVGRLISDTGRLVGVGTLIALILAVIGIVGVVTEGLARRTREIGVRLALGARPYQVTGALATESVLTSLAGLGVGLVVVVTLHEVMASVFFNYFVNELGSSVLDPKVLAAAVAVVLSATLAASFGTARRALSVDPMEALRTD